MLALQAWVCCWIHLYPHSAAFVMSWYVQPCAESVATGIIHQKQLQAPSVDMHSM